MTSSTRAEESVPFKPTDFTSEPPELADRSLSGGAAGYPARRLCAKIHANETALMPPTRTVQFVGKQIASQNAQRGGFPRAI